MRFKCLTLCLIQNGKSFFFLDWGLMLDEFDHYGIWDLIYINVYVKFVDIWVMHSGWSVQHCVWKRIELRPSFVILGFMVEDRVEEFISDAFFVGHISKMTTNI